MPPVLSFPGVRRYDWSLWTRSPRIGVTRWDDVPAEARDRYWARVVEAAAKSSTWTSRRRATRRASSPTLDALMLTGGIDVDPAKLRRRAPSEGEGDRPRSRRDGTRGLHARARTATSPCWRSAAGTSC